MELREKLRLALAAAPVGSAATLSSPAARPSSPSLGMLPVKHLNTQLGRVYLTEERWPLHYHHGHLALGEALEVDDDALARLTPGLGHDDLGHAAFIDIETTGLAGGTGTLAFLVGVATFEGQSLCLRQFFLADISGEEAMLAAISDVLDGCRAIVSFNGRCFDVPHLESRFVLNRLRPPFGPLAHIDLILASRRLFGYRLASCRLAAVEEAVLGLLRASDVPGWAVPRLYFDYLRFGSAEPLSEVLEHNRQDVLSLVTLLACAGQLLANRVPDDPGQCLALARWDEAQGRLDQATRLYRSTIERASGDDHAMALHGLLRIERRHKRWDEMEELLTHALQRDLSASSRIRLLVELAKLKEHRRRDYAAAESLTREAIALREVLQQRFGAPSLSMPTSGDLERRLARLLRRRTSSASFGSGDLVPSGTCH